MKDLIFPKDFVWGAATASYQIEGATDVDGRGVCTWDTFSAKPGKVINNENGLRACNHYNLYKEDVQLMKNIGIDAYRFSFSWPRVFPDGEGNINQKGLDFYDRLIDELLANDITPYATLFHWDLPQALESKYGGWRSKEVSKLFGEYAGVISERFSDRTQNWMTINEIKCFTTLAHREDRHAPGGIEPEKIVWQTVHNALLGHGLAVDAIRANSKQKANIGIVENLDTCWPVIDTKDNIEAARKLWKDLNQYILFPLLKGKYDEKWLNIISDDAPEYTDNEMKIISNPIDFIGYNYYSGLGVRARTQKKVKKEYNRVLGTPVDDSEYEVLEYGKDYPRTDMEWPITPKALYYALKFTKEEFGDIPVYITENGMAAADEETVNGEVIDLSRVEYIRTHLETVNSAIKDGCNVKGYFVWSLMDNFEWAWGYTKRFGICRVNYTTFERYLKLSGKFYKEIIKNNKRSDNY